MLRAAAGARWPMYLRNVKQILRQAEGGFDERRYGFGGLMDLLRAVQKDSFIRMERDRRGGLRVFPGNALQRVSAAPTLPQADVEDEMQADAPLIPVEPETDAEADAQPSVDPTAELLGRATGKRSRSKPAREAAPKKKRAPSRRGSRTKKAAASDGDDDNIGNQ
jgi:hypothetical protein